MALPPGYPLATDKTNATLRQDDHPLHHNAVAEDVNWLAEQVDGGLSSAYQPLSSQGAYSTGLWTTHPGTKSVVIPAEADLEYQPVVIPKALSVDRIAAEVTIVGTVGAVVRLGIYDMGADGKPGALILDAGTISGTSATVQEIIIAQALTPGVKWLASAVQGGAGTRPTMRTITTPGIIQIPGTSANNALTSVRTGWRQAGVAGAFPANAGTLISTGAQAVKTLRFV